MSSVGIMKTEDAARIMNIDERDAPCPTRRE
jgi:hypothetical protein